MTVTTVSRNALYIALAAAASCMPRADAAAVGFTIPAYLKPPASQTLAFEARAVGVQIYTCSAAKIDGAPPAWTLKAPDAVLYDAGGARLGTHYAGPTWEGSDGSKVVGQVKASATPSPDAIAWLLLDVKSAQGDGVFGQITAIQRLETEAGKAPADGCDTASLGQEVRMPYKAVYRFFKAA